MKSRTPTTLVTSPKKRALQYARWGWPVVPLHTVEDGKCSCSQGRDCERPGKHPRTLHGFKDATTDRDQIRKWWEKWPDANVGIAPGREAEILVFDIDPRNGGSETLRKLQAELGALPETDTVETGGGGQHLYFRHPSFKVRKDNAGKLLGAGVDVLSDGCIVVAPPSQHVSGKRYVWAEGRSFDDLKPAKLTKAWRDRLRSGAAEKPAADASKAKAEGLVQKGQRNNHLTRLAGTMQRNGMAPEAISAALTAENAAKCSPPLDATEIVKIVESITRYPANPLPDGVDAAEALMQLTLDRHFAGGRHLLLGKDQRF
jgi:putative DNA primase/helicase